MHYFKDFFCYCSAAGGLRAGQGEQVHITASVENPPMVGHTYQDRMEGPDQGLILAWIRGLEMARETPALKSAALAGELPLLPWRGGVDRSIKKKTKLGAMYYLAMWQGLRDEDLDIDTDREAFLTCSRYGVTVTFTWDLLDQLRGQESEEGVEA